MLLEPILSYQRKGSVVDNWYRSILCITVYRSVVSVSVSTLGLREFPHYPRVTP